MLVLSVLSIYNCIYCFPELLGFCLEELHSLSLSLAKRGRKAAMIDTMAVVHMTEAEVVKDIAAVLAKVRQGSEIVVEQGNRPVAIIKPSKPAGRMISEVIADLKVRGAKVTMDDDFARDIEEGIKAHQQPWNPPSWE